MSELSIPDNIKIYSLSNLAQKLPIGDDEEIELIGQNNIEQYQKDIIKWMSTRETKNARGGIIRAELGLGKTLISLYRIMQVKNRGPSIYICAKTLLLNVKCEINKFFGTKLRYLIMHPEITDSHILEQLTPESLNNYDLIITTYECCSFKSNKLTLGSDRIMIKGNGGIHDGKTVGYKQPKIPSSL